MKARSTLGCVGLLLAAHFAGTAGNWTPASPVASQRTLFSQATQRRLMREFSEARISYLVLDGKGQVMAARWPAMATPRSLGSLLKPVAALAYGESHGFRYPEFVCYGTASGCWRPRGHGRQSLVYAIANSCNSYFRQLSQDLNESEVRQIAGRVGLSGPPADSTGSDLWGAGGRWREAPITMARAYLEIAQRRSQPGYRDIVAGMERSGGIGTGMGAGRKMDALSFLTKTGTAPCEHQPHGAGDGFAVVLWPPAIPKYVVLVEVHGTSGSQAAVAAGRMIRLIEDQETHAQ